MGTIGEESFFGRNYTKVYIMPVIIMIIEMFILIRGKRFSKQHKKLTAEEIRSLNWGEIEKKLGIDASKEPPAHIKRKIFQDSVFARECKWFTHEDIEKWKQKEEKLLRQYEHLLKTHH